MTTIAYKDNIVAYDSRSADDNIVLDDDFDKRIVVSSTNFFLCGAVGDFDEFVTAFINSQNITRDLDVGALIYQNGVLYKSSTHADECGVFRIWKSPIRRESCCAIGSGRNFAFAYMDSGLSAEEAVRNTSKRDLYTGGRIRTFKLT